MDILNYIPGIMLLVVIVVAAHLIIHLRKLRSITKSLENLVREVRQSDTSGTADEAQTRAHAILRTLHEERLREIQKSTIGQIFKSLGIRKPYETQK